jgi:hypothetical protein
VSTLLPKSSSRVLPVSLNVKVPVPLLAEAVASVVLPRRVDGASLSCGAEAIA